MLILDLIVIGFFSMIEGSVLTGLFGLIGLVCLTFLIPAARNHLTFHRVFWSRSSSLGINDHSIRTWWVLFIFATIVVTGIPFLIQITSLIASFFETENPFDAPLIVASSLCFPIPCLYWTIAYWAKQEFVNKPLPDPDLVHSRVISRFSMVVVFACIAITSLASHFMGSLSNRANMEKIVRKTMAVTQRKATVAEESEFKVAIGKTIGKQGSIQRMFVIENGPGCVAAEMKMSSFNGSSMNFDTFYWTQYTLGKPNLIVGVKKIKGHFYATMSSRIENVDEVLRRCALIHSPKP